MQTTQETPAPQPFVHQPQAPWAPRQADVPEQHKREFTGGTNDIELKLSDETTRVRVLRWSDHDYAKLIISTWARSSTTETRLICTAAELRELAARLLDAAHNLDTHPASALVGGAA